MVIDSLKGRRGFPMILSSPPIFLVGRLRNYQASVPFPEAY